MEESRPTTKGSYMDHHNHHKSPSHNDNPNPALTACQVRGARAMLRLSVAELARRTGVSERTITRFEVAYGLIQTSPNTIKTLRQYFELEGMVFIPEDGTPDGPGVRWGRYPGRYKSQEE
jgi:DNA-binding XRE family transcriptional regulator